MGSKYVNEYFKFMGKPDDFGCELEPSEQLQQKYRIHFFSPEEFARRQTKECVRLEYVGGAASIVTYTVVLGRFRLTINLLNLPGCAPSQPGQEIGFGGFGSVLKKCVIGEEFVAKLIRKKPGGYPFSIEEVIMEVAINKLCAMFNIGPDVQTRIPFDLIMYDNAVQFHMEKCRVIEELPRSRLFGPGELMDHIKQCLRVLHKIHVVHRDIKPANILYSNRIRRFVLCDFGVAKYVRQEIGQVSFGDWAGSKRYMGPEMLKLLQQDEVGWVDLYYNDVYGLEKTCQELDRWPIGGAKSRCNVDSLCYVSWEGEKSSKSGNSVEAEEKGIIQQHDSYEFYRVVFAATSLTEHQFDLRANLPKLTKKQVDYVYDIVKNCLNQSKMQQLLNELESLESEEGCAWGYWKQHLGTIVANNFLKHTPQTSKTPIVSKQMIMNLRRLIGHKRELLEMQKQVEKETPHPHNQQFFETTVQLIKQKRYEKRDKTQLSIMENCGQFCRAYGLTSRKVATICGEMNVSFLSYTTSEILNSLIETAFKCLTALKEPFFAHLSSILKREAKAAELLRYIQSETSIEKSVFLSSLHHNLSKESSSEMLEICSHLLSRLRLLPTKYFYEQIINVRRVQFTVQGIRAELNHVAVEDYIRFCNQMLSYSTHEDSFCRVALPAESLMRLQHFDFPLWDIRSAHIKFEQYRSFYAEIVPWNADLLVRNTLRNEDLEVRDAPTNPTSKLILLHRQKRSAFDKEDFESALTILKNIYELEKQDMRSYDQFKDLKFINTIEMAQILAKLDRNNEAYELLLKAKKGILCSALPNQLYYYEIRGQVEQNLKIYEKAHASLTRALQINGIFARSNNQRHRKSILQSKIAYVCADLGRYDESLRQYYTVQKEASHIGFETKYMYLCKNYSEIAETLRRMGRIKECAHQCRKVFELVNRQGLCQSYAVSAHRMMAIISQSSEEKLLHYWAVVENSDTIGGQRWYIAYSHILTHFAPMIGTEALSLGSYVGKFSAVPRAKIKDVSICGILYERPIPSGVLPLDMPIEQFIVEAESRLLGLPKTQHYPCYIFKSRLLKVFSFQQKFHPQCELFYLRTLVQMHLHQLIAGDLQGLIRDLPESLDAMQSFPVTCENKLRKDLLVEFANDVRRRSTATIANSRSKHHRG